MQLKRQATKAVVDERRQRQHPSQLIRQLVYALFNKTRHTVDVNEDMSSSRLENWLSG